MHLLLPRPILLRLERELKRARRREIGGLLLGEHVSGETFRLVEITVQRSGGSAVHFIRDPGRHQAQLDEFFGRTGADYTKFNYLGEWHSHPSFEPLPSGTDISTMQSIVEDPEVGVNFLVLLIAMLTRWRHLKLSAMMFQAGVAPAFVTMSLEGEPSGGEGFFAKVLRIFFRR